MAKVVEFGKKTWRDVTFADVFPDRRRNRVIGMSFPRQHAALGLEPSILTVLPPGDNVEYDSANRDYNDDDVLYYCCSVYISGLAEFKAWALKHDPAKIVVGGYHPTTFPEDFTRFAFKIVQGPCDALFDTIAQSGQVVTGIVKNETLPRRDLYDIARLNQQIIPDKKPNDVVVSINTSMGCAVTPPCDFCCTPIMCPKLLCRPTDIVEREALSLRQYDPKFCFIRDENFTMQKDWRDRLAMLHRCLPETKLYLFASANTLNTEDKVAYLAAHGVYMVCLGLEDPTKDYGKNKNLDQVMALLKKYHVYAYLSFIVNPLEIIGQEAGKAFYEKLMTRLFELGPEMICGNFLMPFRGTGLWDKYFGLVSEDDYPYYDSKTPFLVKNPVLQEKMKFFMFWYQYLYYTSDFYRDNVRQFDVEDTLHLRFTELYVDFRHRYEVIWDRRA